MGLLGEPAWQLFRFERQGLLEGEWWRWWTGHWVHFGVKHLLVNLLGLALLVVLVSPWLRPLHLIFLAVVTSSVISGALWLFHPNLEVYVGLSGVCAGIWAAGAVAGMRGGHYLAFLLFLLLLLRLLLDYFLPSEQSGFFSISGRVIVEAHLYGAVSGVVYSLVIGKSRLLPTYSDESGDLGI